MCAAWRRSPANKYKKSSAAGGGTHRRCVPPKIAMPDFGHCEIIIYYIPNIYGVTGRSFSAAAGSSNNPNTAEPLPDIEA